MTMRSVSWVLPLAALLAASATGEPHVHGKGRLALAPSPNGVQFELVVAAADVWGFEYEPRTPEETALRDAALATLEDSLPEILQFPHKLGCVHDSSTVTAEVLESDSGQTESPVEETHTHDHEHRNDREHRHDHKHNHDHDHDHDHKHDQGTHDEPAQEHVEGGEGAEGHVEVQATARWNCRRSPLGHDIEVRRPPEIPGLSVLEVWVLGASGQNSILLRQASATVELQ